MRPSYVLAAGLSCLLGVSSSVAVETGAGAQAESGQPEVFYERVWYRTPDKRIPLNGDLTVTGAGVDFVTPKQSIHVPPERIQILSYGPLKGDVDTNWLLLGIGDSLPEEVLAFRDGTKFGYGPRTREIYEAVRTVFEQTGAAQFRAPPGFEPYGRADAQFALAIPAGWEDYLESVIYVGDEAPWGTIVFSSEPIQRVEIADEGHLRLELNDQALEQVLAGQAEAFAVDRLESSRGMRCDGFTEKAVKRTLELVARDPLFNPPYEVLEPPASGPASVGRCDGLRIRGRSLAPDGRRVVFDAYAAAHRDTLFVFELRALEDRYEQFRETFEAVLGTVRFSVAR